jgi:amino acid transporter
MLPFSERLRTVHPQTRTPTIAILISGALTVGFILWGYFGLDSFLVLVVASAAFPYVIYLFTLIAYWMRRRQLAASPTLFQLGRWAGPVLVAALIWDVIVLVCLMTPSDFHKADWLIIGVPVLAVAWYVAVLRNRVKSGVAGARSSSVAAQETSATEP